MTTSGAAVRPADVSDAGLRPIAPQIALLGLSSAAIAVTDSLSVAGIAGLFAGSIGDAEPKLKTFEWLANPWVVFAFVIATFVLNLVNTVIRENVTSTWEADRRLDLVMAYRRADFETQAANSGSALSVSAEQIGQASQLIGAVAGLLNTILRAVVYLGVAFVASPVVSLVAIVVGGVLVVGLRTLTKRTRIMHRRIAADRVAIGEQIGDMTSSSRELHLLDRWDDIVDDLAARIGKVRHDRFRSSSLATMVGPIYWAGTLFVGLILAAVVRRTSGDLQGLAAAGLLLIRALGAAQAAQVMYQTHNDATPYMERTLDVIARLRAARREPGIATTSEHPTLRCTTLTLSYGNDVVVRDLDLELAGTGGIALVGPSGSGKSTTLHALSGFLAPVAGVVTADGIPLDLLPGAELGRAIGLLPQDPRLFRASLRDNMVRPEKAGDDGELSAALARVDLTATVAAFSDGLDSEMGRGGEGLSGGEMQRLGLLRLLLNQPDIWLLDEPTSALDKANGDRVVEVITEAMADHLVVVVTHRPELLQHCDRIVYMDEGRLVDSGTLAELIDRQPFVAAMVGR